MTRPNTGELQPEEAPGAELKSYAVGLLVSFLLSAGAFAAAFSELPTNWKVIIICLAALLQIMAHLRNFLHLNFSGGQSREDLLLVMFSVCLLVIMAGGTWYIMSDLSGRMHQNGADHAMERPAASQGL